MTLPGAAVDVPVLPEMDRAFGYEGDARYVAFSWAYDHFSYDDGASRGSAAGWAFQAYARHPAVAPLLAGHDLGGSDHEASEVFLLDREGGRVSIAPIAQARVFLQAQHPEPVPLSEEQMEEVRRRFDELLAEERSRPIDPEQIQRAMDEQRARVARMMSWLDLCPEADRGRG